MSNAKAGSKSAGPRRGVVLVVTMFALLLLAGLVLWVLNIGQQVNNRITTQNTADATVRAGSGWVARTLNMIASNNVAIAHYIATVDVMDSMPQASQFALKETKKLRESLAGQLGRGVGPSPAQLAVELNRLFNGMLAEMDGEINDMTPVVELFQGFDVSKMTSYKNNGNLWQAMTALDEMNGAMLDSLGPASQLAANRGGEINMGGESDASSLLLPLTPNVPAKRGSFNDFELPVRLGILPPAADDRHYNRGPWDAVFGWRDVVGIYVGGTYVPGTSNGAGNAQGKGIGVTRGADGGSGGQMVGQEFIPSNYVTYGPQEWLFRIVGNYVSSKLRLTRFDWYERNIAEAKLAFLWPNPIPVITPPGSSVVPSNINRPWPAISGGRLANVYDPDWRIDFNEATAIADAGTPTIKETAFFIIEIKSRYPAGDGKFMSPGSWKTVDEGGQYSPRIAIVGGWNDPRKFKAKQVANYVWRDEWDYTVNFDTSIGIMPQFTTANGPDGKPVQTPVAQPVYRIDTVAFAGVNVGDGTNITNPFEGLNPSSADAPAPTDFDHTAIKPDDQNNRWQHFSYLGVTRRTDRPQAWPTRFRGGRPSPNMVAVAQAHVFNNHSFDLWTPMWRAELEPVSNYEGWLTRMDGGDSGGGAQASDANNVNAAEVELAKTYLTNARSLAATTLAH
jgi:hypothetical protein